MKFNITGNETTDNCREINFQYIENSLNVVKAIISTNRPKKETVESGAIYYELDTGKLVYLNTVTNQWMYILASNAENGLDTPKEEEPNEKPNDGNNDTPTEEPNDKPNDGNNDTSIEEPKEPEDAPPIEEEPNVNDKPIEKPEEPKEPEIEEDDVPIEKPNVPNIPDINDNNSVDEILKNVSSELIYDMEKEYDDSKTDEENLKLAIDSGKPYIYLNKDLALPKGRIDDEYIWVNRPVYIFGNLKNELDIAIRITADGVTLDGLYLRREIRPNRAFNDLTIKNCIVDGSEGMGLHFLVYTDGMVCKNIVVENCIFRNNAWHGLAFKGNIPSANKPAKGGNGVGYGTYENVVIRNCIAHDNGFVVKSDGTLESDHEYSAGINVVDSCLLMRNCVVENCESYRNYSNGFHMESVPVKENVVIRNCIAYENGRNEKGTHFGCGFSTVDEGVVLENCISRDNIVANYTVLKNQAHSPMKTFNGELINCYDDEMIINWNDEIAESVYNGKNLIFNGNFNYGSMHYGFYYSTYPCWFFNAPNFLRRNGYKTAYYEADIHMDENRNKPFIHGKFMTNLFMLDDNKKYRLTVEVDNSKNTTKETFTMGLMRYNYVSDKDVEANRIDKTVGVLTLVDNKDCNVGITTYTAEVSTETLSKFTSGYYSLFSKNSIIDTKIPLNNINPNELNIKIYSIRLEEI